MLHNAFIYPEVITDTPRLFTAIAEWMAVFVYFNLYKRKLTGFRYINACIISFIAFTGLHYIAGILPLFMWIPMMTAAVTAMYISLLAVLEVKSRDCGVLTSGAFVLAEFAASVYRQLYVWASALTDSENLVLSFTMMIVIYPIVFHTFRVSAGPVINTDSPLEVNRKELFAFLITGITVFFMSNLSFIWTATPFSATGNILYVRTLIDLGGLLMIITQLERRNEISVRLENDEINSLFRKQYGQYKLALDNSEMLRRELHDLKHYLIALKAEDDPVKRGEIINDMEQAIAIQESFMNTGNQVLDVILTTKSLECKKRSINLSAMVDGDPLANIHVKDLCSLFGNILDNAIEATQTIPDTDKRVISLSVKKKNRFILVECDNYIDNSVSIRGELPETTKADKEHHGYGLKSIRQVAEKYGGAMNISTEDHWFKVKVLLAV